MLDLIFSLYKQRMNEKHDPCQSDVRYIFICIPSIIIYNNNVNITLRHSCIYIYSLL